jgi:pilus assembly protein CpaB
MNLQRMLILGLAAIAAGAAALIVRGFLGGSTPSVQAALAPPVPMTDVLVAANDIQPGTHLSGTDVHWQKWPKSSVAASFITTAGNLNPDDAVRGTVVRAPLVAGQPVTNDNIVHTDAAGVMAANLTPGMRALAIVVSTDTGAGGFILPNDRVDLIGTMQVSETPKRFKTVTLLENLRVLAMDQTYKEDANQKVVLAKTATLEVTPAQAELVQAASAAGTLSLALRSLADSSASALAASALDANPRGNASIAIMRYGLPRTGGEPKGE